MAAVYYLIISSVLLFTGYLIVSKIRFDKKISKMTGRDVKQLIQSNNASKNSPISDEFINKLFIKTKRKIYKEIKKNPIRNSCEIELNLNKPLKKINCYCDDDDAKYVICNIGKKLKDKLEKDDFIVNDYGRRWEAMAHIEYLKMKISW